MSEFWRMRSTQVGRKEMWERWGRSRKEVDEHINGLATHGMFIITPLERQGNCEAWLVESRSRLPLCTYLYEVWPDDEYTPDLLGQFFGRHTIDPFTGKRTDGQPDSEAS